MTQSAYDATTEAPEAVIEALDSLDEVTPLPVMQLLTWSPQDEPIHFGVSVMCVMLFAVLVYNEAGLLLAALAGVSLMVTLWRLLLPIRYELDARGVQQIVLGLRSFRPWSDFRRYEVDAKGVCLISREQGYPLLRAGGLTIFADREHLKLVQLVSTYVGQAPLASESPTLRAPTAIHGRSQQEPMP